MFEREVNTPKVTFVVPVYNTEEFVGATLDSLLGQSLTNIEVICVNDASPDGALAVLKSYAAKDPRVTVLDLERNGGVSNARNKGLEIARGEYVWFMDSDDMLHREAARLMVAAADSCGADFAFTPTRKIDGNATQESIDIPIPFTWEKSLSVTDPFRVYPNQFGPQHGLFRRASIGSLRFDTSLMFGEDRDFWWRFLVNAKCCAYVPAPLFNYRKREDSVCHTTSLEKIKSQLLSVAERGRQMLAGDLHPELRTLITEMCERMEVGDLLPAPEYRACYAVAASDDARMHSSSGAAFAVIAEHFIEKGGFVAGAAFQSDWSVAHELVTDLAGIERFKGSKYVRSALTHPFLAELDAAVATGRPVLFSGCPCQVAAIRKRHPDAANLVLLDLVCHGAPDAELWKKRVAELSRQGRIKAMTFRGKSDTGNWAFVFRAEYEDGTEYVAKAFQDPYMAAFSHDLMISSACAACPFSRSGRPGDVTCGDFWELRGSMIDDGKGLSCLVASTAKGKKLLNEVLPRFEKALEYPVSTITQPNFHGPSRPHPSARDFQNAVKAGMDFAAALEKYKCDPRNVAIFNFQWERRNFGAVLTSFALSRYIADLGYQPRNVDLCPVEPGKLPISANPCFEAFCEKYIPLTALCDTKAKLAFLNASFPTFVTGSDQVWSANLIRGNEDAYFLSFAKPGKRLISAAGSFGWVPASERDPEELKTRLGVFTAVSVREQSDADTLRSLGCECTCVPDPVFWLKKRVWQELAATATPAGVKGAVAVYTVDKRAQQTVILEALAKAGLATAEKPATLLSSAFSPEEWVATIRDAGFVATDSFHGTCFAILMHTPFAVYHPIAGQNARHKSLLSALGLERMLAETEEDFARLLDAREVPDWEDVDSRLESYAEEGRDFIRQALEKPVENSPNMAAKWRKLADFRKVASTSRKSLAVRETFARLWAERKAAKLPDKPTISVIIPVHNAEKYLDECLASVFAVDVPQDLEVICINDGSTDSSAELLSLWAEATPRIRVITQRNSGQGAARNNGLAAAHGEYVLFLDADDALCSGAVISAALAKARSLSLDLLLLGSMDISEAGEEIDGAGSTLQKQYLPEKEVFAGDDVGDDLFLVTIGTPWSKLYRRTFLEENKLVFPSLVRSEDFPFVQLCLALSRRTAALDEPLTRHRIGGTASLEATKDAAPVVFVEAEQAFRSELHRRGLWERFRSAAAVSTVRRFAYNFGAVRRFASFVSIAKVLGEEYASLREELPAERPPEIDAAVRLLERLYDDSKSIYALADDFAERRTLKVRGEGRAKHRAAQQMYDELFAKFKAAQKRRGELFTKLQESQKARREQFTKLQESQRARRELFTKLQESQRARGELFKKLQESQKARGELFKNLQESQKARRELFAKLQESQKARGVLFRKVTNLAADNARKSNDDAGARVNAAKFAADSAHKDNALKQARREALQTRRKMDFYRREAAALSNSESYRIGLAVTWPARKLKGGVLCLKENGLKYTIKHFCGKVARKCGVKSEW